jgi:hypothetical protein
MNLQTIQKFIEENQYRLTRHAWEGCRRRQIRLQDVKDAVKVGQIIETHVDDWEFDCYLIAGERFNGDTIHVACKIVEDVLQINAVYFPHSHLWEKDRRRKKR